MEARLGPNGAEAEAILTVCLLAAFADGGKSEVERSAIKAIMHNLPETGLNLAPLYQCVLLGQVSLAQAAQPLQRAESRQLSYEMAVCVCEADYLLTPLEKNFLDQLRQVLRLDANVAMRVEKEVKAIAFPDLAKAVSAPVLAEARIPGGAVAARTKADDMNGMILNCSILNGALELLPQSLATLGIIPLQMKMVYRIGKHFGYDLDRGHIKGLLASAGIGLSSQVLEGFAAKLFGGLFGRLGGKFGNAVANQATGSALSFAATYAIGHVAQNYYAGGRTLSSIEMRSLFGRFKTEASGLYAQHAGAIRQQASGLNTKRLFNLVHAQ